MLRADIEMDQLIQYLRKVRKAQRAPVSTAEPWHVWLKHPELVREVDFMAVSSYGSATRTSGVVRIVKDLDVDLTGRHVLVVEDIIDFMQLQGVRDELVDAIPIGLKKRVELARALVAEPSFLILDEPMAGMNQEEKEYMARFVLDARDERGVTVLLIEHHMDIITGICDRMLVLSYGEVIDTGIGIK